MGVSGGEASEEFSKFSLEKQKFLLKFLQKIEFFLLLFNYFGNNFGPFGPRA